jgi:hypothetical protein
VWFAEVENFLGRARLDELRQHFAPEMARVLDLAVQLAVRERAGAAFAELHVRFRIELRFPPEFPRILGALAHFLAALEHDRTKTHLRQQQRREQTTRAESYHHRAERQPHGRRRDELIARIRRDRHAPIALQAREHGRLVLHFRIERVDERDRRGPARVVSAAHDRKADQRVGSDLEALKNNRLDGARRVIER